MVNLLSKIGTGIVLAGLSIGIGGCQNPRGYFGANDPALKYLPDAQKQDAERIAGSLKGGIPIYVIKRWLVKIINQVFWI